MTTYYATANRCGNFDYDCNGSAEPRYGAGTCGLANSTCSNRRQGFIGSVPACGADGTFLLDCRAEYVFALRVWICRPDVTEMRAQSCR